jgi:hypothetical protein
VAGRVHRRRPEPGHAGRHAADPDALRWHHASHDGADGPLGPGLHRPRAGSPLVEPSFEAARAARTQAGRDGLPRLVTIPYFALGEPDQGRANIRHYYAWMGEETASMAEGAVCGSAEGVKAFVDSFPAIGVDEIIFNPATDDVDEVNRLAEIVL